MQMFVAAGWRDGMKNSGGMRDLKSLFWTLVEYVRRGRHRGLLMQAKLGEYKMLVGRVDGVLNNLGVKGRKIGRL